MPSPTPELDALVASLASVTSRLSLTPLLEDALDTKRASRLRAGDLVELVVFGREEFSRTTRVSAQGTLDVFLLGEVPVVGRTPGEAASAIKVQLEERYLRQASVSLLISERSPVQVRVHGRVLRPGLVELPLHQPLGLGGLLTRTGGLLPDADPTGLALIRQAAGARQAYAFSLDELLAAQARGREVWLEPDDQLVVARLPTVFVYGSVTKPGGYPLKRDTTVASLLFEAGGLTEDGDSRGIRVMTGASGLRQASLDSRLDPLEVVFVPKRERIYVVGAGVVNNGPLELPRSGWTVVQAIAEAGWFTNRALLDNVEVIRYQDGKQVRIQVPVEEILDGEQVEADCRLLPGDLIFVPRSIW